MNKTIKFLINQKDNNKRIDIFLSKNIPEYSRSYIKKTFLKEFGLCKWLNFKYSFKKKSKQRIRF